MIYFKFYDPKIDIVNRKYKQMFNVRFQFFKLNLQQLSLRILYLTYSFFFFKLNLQQHSFRILYQFVNLTNFILIIKCLFSFFIKYFFTFSIKLLFTVITFINNLLCNICILMCLSNYSHYHLFLIIIILLFL